MTDYPTTTEGWKDWLKSYKVDDSYPDDSWAYQCCVLANEASQFGNFGVGSVLVCPDGQVAAQGHNEVFNPYFRSDRHSEMVAMEKFEEGNQTITSMKGYTLYTSLESCPMCMARLITSGCERVLYVAADTGGGMVHRAMELPPVWQHLGSPPRQYWGAAKCSPNLQTAALKIFCLNAEELNCKLERR